MPAECVIGVDLGGTKLLGGTVDPQLTVQHRAHRLAAGSDQEAVLRTIAGVVGELRDASEAPVAAVGLGVPCTIDHERGIAVQAVHLPIAELAIADVMSERVALPVFVDNDANAAMLAEHRFGAARGARNAVMLTLGTGVGGGLILDGKLYRGSQGAAAELGHMVIETDGPPCGPACSNHGCLESLASGTALGREGARVARDAPDSQLGRSVAAGHEITGALVTELAHDGDPAARDVVALIGMRLGVGVANLVNIFNPDVVVVGGGVIAAGELLLEPVRRVLAQRALEPGRSHTRVVPAAFGAESGMLGAATLALEGIERRAAA